MFPGFMNRFTNLFNRSSTRKAVHEAALAHVNDDASSKLGSSLPPKLSDVHGKGDKDSKGKEETGLYALFSSASSKLLMIPPMEKKKEIKRWNRDGSEKAADVERRAVQKFKTSLEKASRMSLSSDMSGLLHPTALLGVSRSSALFVCFLFAHFVVVGHMLPISFLFFIMHRQVCCDV